MAQAWSPSSVARRLITWCCHALEGFAATPGPCRDLDCRHVHALRCTQDRRRRWPCPARLRLTGRSVRRSREASSGIDMGPVSDCALFAPGLVMVEPLAAPVTATTLILLVIDGVLYSIGVVFHLWRSLPFRKAVWHAIVLAGTACHFGAVTSAVFV
jgi:hypothetical protein